MPDTTLTDTEYDELWDRVVAQSDAIAELRAGVDPLAATLTEFVEVLHELGDTLEAKG